ncbi:hypothetical protein ACQKM1_22405 [Peribacillus frigoritolerans]|uniref:hypothetical protein n=1 Tax=Peribacillus frigoritolerans TaxID=450367 RepID=UPI003D00FF8F
MTDRIVNKIIIFLMICDAINALDGAITGEVAETVKHSAWFVAMGLLLAYRRIREENER